jgi:DNA-binding FrmR family transcriptional regulator
MRKEAQNKDVLTRLKRVEGQIRGLQRMVEKGVDCSDILTQVSAATAAIKRVGMIILQAYMEECLSQTKKGPSAKREETLKSFQEALSRYIDWT